LGHVVHQGPQITQRQQTREPVWFDVMDGTITGNRTLQRSRGTADLAFRRGNLVRLYQRGAAKALLPRTYGPFQEAVLVNTAGGITGGDRYRYGCDANASRVVVTTQAAERAYRSSTKDIASMEVRLAATGGAALHWLPQETILFDGSRLVRHINVELDRTSECLVLESLVFGRHAMGERLQTCHFTDSWRIHRDGRLVHAEALSLTDDIGQLLAATAAAGHAQMAATLVYVGPRLDLIQADISAVLPSLASRAAISCWQGRFVLRLMATETMAGKADLSRILGSLRGQQVPRVWQS
jgi:urease accessory protein